MRTVETRNRPTISRLTSRLRGRPGRLTVPHEWHVGVSPLGSSTRQETDCPCPKGHCGLAVPRADVFCRVHQGEVEYRQAHSARDCHRPVWLRLGDRLTRLH